MTDAAYWAQRSVYWGLEHEGCGHLGIAARDKAAVLAYLEAFPEGWMLINPTRQQLKDAHDNVECARCRMPDLIKTAKAKPPKTRKARTP